MKWDEIKSIEGLFESPNLIAKSEFGLNVPTYNESLAQELLGSITQVYEDTHTYKFFRSGNETEGTICVVDKSVWQLTYYILYNVHNIPVIGTSATQVLLWRADAGAKPSNITQRVFFDILLYKWKTITSDTSQTDAGRRFWLTQMDAAFERGFNVGLVSVKEDTVEWFDKSLASSASRWAKDSNAWGEGDTFENYRFIITSDKSLTEKE